ncbi:siderophore-interacting protein [Streptomyces monticola]|uniref:Siderophore-interacting protein n=1 Tax=Streptomyces monticola TaxID=2666263 RepID=A0ABW2JM89_9ACTN
MTYEAQQLPIRFIEVTGVRRITPRMARITFGGADLADFRIAGPDQQVKLYFPKPGQARPRLPERGGDGTGDTDGAHGDLIRWYEAYTALPEAERPWMRSYTVRAHHPQEAAVDIDFVLHGDSAQDAASADGPATRWAAAAQPGDVLGMFGPSAYFTKPVPLGTTDWTLLAGDESALPALGTIIEALPEGARATAYVEIADADEEQAFTTEGDVTVHWLHRAAGPAGHGSLLLDAVRAAEFPAGSVYAWLAGESGAVRGLRRHLVDERGIDKSAIDFAGYWRRRLTRDDAPTAEDLADAQELLGREA